MRPSLSWKKARLVPFAGRPDGNMANVWRECSPSPSASLFYSFSNLLYGWSESGIRPGKGQRRNKERQNGAQSAWVKFHRPRLGPCIPVKIKIRLPMLQRLKITWTPFAFFIFLQPYLTTNSSGLLNILPLRHSKVIRLYPVEVQLGGRKLVWMQVF